MAYVTVKCANENCSKEFQARADKIAKGQGKYCTRKCSSESQKGIPISDEKRRKLKEAHNRPETRQRHREATIRQLLSKPRQTRGTPLEQKIAEELRKRKISFLTQQPFLNKYVVDFLLRDYPIIIEADGAVHGLPAQMEHDKRRDAELYDAGYIVLRFQGKVIHHNINACGDKVAEVIQEGVECGRWKPIDLENFSEVIGDQRGPNNPMFGKKPWNKGLTVADNEKVADYIAKWKKTMDERGYWDKWRGQPRTDAPWENLKDDYERLGSLVRVAELYGVGRTTVHRQLKAQGITVFRKRNK